MSDETPDWANSFGSVAEAYDRGRPTYPREAAAWLVGAEPVTVLELGCGTGKLTEQLVAIGHDVHATDPDAAMLEILAKRLPDVRSSQASAEDIPMPDRSVDVVVCAQAFHWFDLDRALPEIARVLKPGGRLALVWNYRDDRIPWVRRLGKLIGSHDQLAGPEQLPGPEDGLVTSSLFGFVESELFRFWQLVDRASIQDLVLSRSNVAVLDAEGRAAKLAEVVAFYDDYGRGMDGMQLPYEARCFRAALVDQPRTPAEDEQDDPVEPTGSGRRTDDGGEETQPLRRSADNDVSDGTDTDMLLIDFR